MCMNGDGCEPIKLHLQKQPERQILPQDCGLPIADGGSGLYDAATVSSSSRGDTGSPPGLNGPTTAHCPTSPLLPGTPPHTHLWTCQASPCVHSTRPSRLPLLQSPSHRTLQRNTAQPINSGDLQRLGKHRFKHEAGPSLPKWHKAGYADSPE